MRSLAAICFALMPLAAVGETCRPIVDQIHYCTDMKERNAFVTRAAMPDLVTSYHLQSDPLVTSHIALMPIDRELKSWDDVFDMVTFQIMGKATARFASISDIVRGPGKVGNADTMRVEMLGRHRDGRVMAAVVVEAIPRKDDVLIIYTVQERLDGMDDNLIALHVASLTNLKAK